MKINAGCGRHVLDGWTNVDIAPSPLASRAPDILADVRSIPLPDGCADELMAIHLFEHFHPWEAPKLLAEWHRLLKPGGVLILEMPDLVKCCKNVLSNVMKGGRALEQLGMWGLYGDPRDENPYMAHRWGWTYDTLAPLLKAAGFSAFRQRPTQWHPAGRQHRDFRVEAIK